jgi:hypothetical protein
MTKLFGVDMGRVCCFDLKILEVFFCIDPGRYSNQEYNRTMLELGKKRDDTKVRQNRGTIFWWLATEVIIILNL